MGKMPNFYEKFTFGAPLPTFPMGNMPHTLYQKMRLDEICRKRLVPGLDDVPVGRYREMPKKFLGKFQLASRLHIFAMG